MRSRLGRHFIKAGLEFIVPGFYRYLQAQDEKAQIENAEELKEQISKLVDAADKSGPFFLGDKMTFVDVQPYRGWPEPEADSRWAKWVDAIEQDHAVRATTSTDELYLDSYERYADAGTGLAFAEP
ncbi:hypothetical protein D6C76_02017 [Aureobasidium pullulans]|uniref:Glutathione S-transferase n=1 Tax=Aureobasidium pullulans TaxID=5580 RepID=A0AB74J1Z2_AURPU|nr:hypothetical protein D6D21_03799 [Aureobasidium pullulans]TIA83612.1 hypothetical protein D6C76_02017 [Aureobasidium pullulans]